MLLEGNRLVKAVGESHYQDALARVCGGKTADGHRLPVVATLIPEPDNPYDENAVAVHVQGSKVAHLSRADAAAMHQQILLLMEEEGRAIGCRAEIVGGWRRGHDDEGHFGVRLFFDPLSQEPIDRSSREAPVELSEAARAALEEARHRVGHRVTSGSPDGTYDGRHYTEWVDAVRDLKREGRINEAIDLLQHLVDVVEDEATSQNSGVAPWYYEQLAICFRKSKDYAAEVAILDRYARRRHAPGAVPPKLIERLEKAQRLLAQADEMS